MHFLDSLSLSRHSSLSSIASGRFYRLHPVSVQSYSRLVLVGRPTLARPFIGVQKKSSFMSSSLLLQHCPTNLARLIRMVLEMRGFWLYSWNFCGCYFLDLFNITCSILVQFPSSFFLIRFVSVHVVHPQCTSNTTATWKLRFILSERQLGYWGTYSCSLKILYTFYKLSNLKMNN